MRTGCARGGRKRFAQWAAQLALKQEFAAVHICGDWLTLRNEDTPTLYFANHSSAWDLSIVAHATTRLLRQDPFVMTDESSMWPLAHWSGAFSVDSSDPFETARSMRYVRDLLSQPKTAVWIFPQGGIYMDSQRPLGFKAGIEHILRQGGGARAVAVACRYMFCSRLRPEVFINFGTPIPLGGQRYLKRAESDQMVVQLLDDLALRLMGQRKGDFHTILLGHRRILDAAQQHQSNVALHSWGLRGQVSTINRNE